MTPTPDLEAILRDVISEFVVATPDWWDNGELRLSFSSDDGTDSCKHEFANAKFDNDIVVATEERMLTTRLLSLRFKKMGVPLKAATFTISQGDDGQWHFTTDFTYQ